MVDAIKGVAKDLTVWSATCLVKLEKRIARQKKELEACQRSAISPKSVRHEQLLKYKLERMEYQLDLYLKQRDLYMNWMEKGDKNTSYFQAYASARKKMNHISKLKKKMEGG